MNQNEAILHLDDDPNDRELFALAFQRTGCLGQLKSVASGNDALSYLRGKGDYADRKQFPVPKYIITDLKMTDGDGLQFLKALRSTPDGRAYPVVVLSGSGDEDDVKHAFLLGAAAYFTKRHAMCELIHLVRTLYEFMDMSEHPQRDEFGQLLPTVSRGKLGAGLTTQPCIPRNGPTT